MDLFDDLKPIKQEIINDVYLLQGFALGASERLLLIALQAVIINAPLCNMMTKMGFAMSAAMTNCGDLGWISDRKGYRYDGHNPLTNQPWPDMPASFLQLATSAAAECGYVNFVPDACLINQYIVGASMGLHQDKNEQDFSQPIVSVSLGIPATFQFGGLKRSDKTLKIPVNHGDVVVWGGEARLKFHAVMPLKANHHKALGDYRYNLTFRKAG
ncbi:MAG: DNA oxidative demethylase AlkB [Bdellovibrio sp.]|nr:DNA oxidative demethylase AlkB [Methylotenera sp.]